MTYISDVLGIKLKVAKTGIKYLISAAKQYDLGIYSESNGHSNIYYNIELKSKLDKLNCFCMNSRDVQILESLTYFLSIFNISAGDAISLLLAVESGLKLLNLQIKDLLSLYDEFPSLNSKIRVKDKNQFVSNFDETRLLEPACNNY